MNVRGPFFQKNKWIHLFSLLSGFLLSSLAIANSQLVIQSMHSDPGPKKAFQEAVEDFKKENPDVKVKLNTVDHESYKIQIRTWLPNNPPDIATWFAGNRAEFFVEKGLIEPIDDVWQGVENEFSKSSAAASTFNGKKYLLPTTYYQWGIYYRKDIFEKVGVTPPKTWDELLKVVDKLNQSKITPFTIGIKQPWPAAAWFDLINLRTQGYEKYMELLSGKSTYDSEPVSKALDYWAELIDRKAFPTTANAMTWQEAAALLWQGKSAMYLMGNFLVTDMPKDMKDKLGFFPFPTINPNVPRAEVAPVDVYFIPSKAKNKLAAKKFLKFLARKEVQSKISSIQTLLPANSKAPIDENDPFLKAGKELLESATYVTQFFDRDANPQVAKVGMNAFVEFMNFPQRKMAALKKIERTRKRVHR